jgi:hypothetical protein
LSRPRLRPALGRVTVQSVEALTLTAPVEHGIVEYLSAQVLSLGIQALDDTRFADLCNDVLISATIAHGLPRAILNTTLRVTEPDGGIDARCVESPRTVGRLIPRRSVAYQFKSGTTRKSAIQVADEDIVGKPRVAEALTNGHSLVYIAAWDRGDEFESAILSSVRERGLAVEHDQIVFLGGDALSRLLAAQPGVVARFLRIDEHLFSFEDWSRLPWLSNPFQRDTSLNRRLSDLIALLGAPRAIIRLVGAAGHGKTRTILEALRGSDLERTTLYARESSALTPAFISYLRRTPDAICTMVVDEIDDEDADRLRDYFAAMPENVRLVLVGRDASGRAQQGTLQVEGLNEELLVATIAAIVPGLPQGVPETIARVCERSPKLAVVIASRILEDPSLVAHHRLLGDASIRQVLDRYLELRLGDDAWRAISAVALMERVGWTGDVDSESERLFTALGMDSSGARLAVEDLDRRLGVAPRANRFRYVSPTILADHLAARQIETWTKAQLQRVLDAFTPAMRDSFTRRLRRLAGVLENRTIVETVVFGEHGPFRSLNDLEESRQGALLNHLAGAFPHASTRALQRIIEPASPEQLRAANRARRDLVFALEQLLWPETTFEAAAILLLKLAVAENETWGNNATGIWTETFQTMLGRTAAGLAARQRVLHRAVTSENADKRRLAAQALGAALRTGNITRGGMPPSDVPGMPSAEWRPATYGEWWDAIRAYLKLLAPLLSDTTQAVRQVAVEALISGIHAATTFPTVTDAWITLAQTVAVGDQQLRGALIDAIEREVRRLRRRWSDQVPTAGAEVTDAPEEQAIRRELAHKLVTLHQTLLGADPSSRFRWLISRNPWRMPDEELLVGDRSLDDMLANLARDIVTDPSRLEAEWDWLLNANHPVPERWFDLVGRHDHERRVAPMLESVAQRNERAWHWLSLYEAAWAETAGDPGFLDRRARELLTAGTPAMHVVGLLARAGYTRDRFLLIRDLLRERALAGSQITQLTFSPWLPSLSEHEASELASFAAADPDATLQVVSFLTQYLHHFPDRRSSFQAVALRLLGQRWIAPSGSFMEHEWVRLAELYVSDDPRSIAAAVLEQAAVDKHSLDKELADVLRKAWEVGDKHTIFDELIGPWLDEDTDASAAWRLRRTLKGFPVHELGLDHLTNWIAAKPKHRARAIAELIGPPTGQLSEVHAMLLERFHDADVAGIIYGEYVSGTWWGPASDRTRGLLETARSWLADHRPAVRNWAREVVHALEDMLRADEAREAEERFS